MNHPKAASKHLKSLNVAGFGDYIHFSSDPELGQGIYGIDLDGGVLKIFEKGVAVNFKGESFNILYSGIRNITSYLSAAVFSQASATQNVDVSIPLEIHFSEGVAVFEVKLLIYSRVLIVLNDMWRSLKK
ncbi:hypothetical protein [Pseudomonas putida]|uniref:hypothetical protein n=1 Tax=Pseudomonas putida TaxID=303 RepID=UPI00130E9140|nr:hypothetical protein [Pseudomonas putida]